MDPSAQPKSSRFWLWAGLAFVAAWFIFLVVAGPRMPKDSGAGRAGALADFSWKLQSLEGAPASLAQFRGKTIFLNIWATWCPPCVREMPSIVRLANDPRVKDVAFVCVSVDNSLEPVRKFVSDNGLPMTILWANGGVPDVFETEGIPATFIIAPDGRIAFSETGSSEWDAPEVVQRLEKLARSAPVPPAHPGPVSIATEPPAPAAGEGATQPAEPSGPDTQSTPGEPPPAPPAPPFRGRRGFPGRD